MTFGDLALTTAVVALLALVALFTAIQNLYLEGMRLRARELPALQFFKSEFEPRLNMRSEDGALTFSLWKHSCLVVFGVVMLARNIDGEPLKPLELAESIVFAWLGMIVFAYLIPQFLLRRTSGRWLNGFQPVFAVAALMARPVVATLDFIHSLLDIVKQENGDEEPATPAENIEALISAGEEEGLIEEDDRKLIQSVMEFGDKLVREVMTPRPDIVAIQARATLAALHALVVNEQYSRIVVYEGTIDDVLGFVHVRDMFEVAESTRESRLVHELMRPILVVPETKPVDDLMRQMQAEGRQIALVVDEYGNTAGLATMEDLLELILGEIRDEHEPDSDVTKDGRGGIIVSGNFEVARLEEQLPFHPEEEIESTTVGGLILEWIGHVPKPGEFAERDGIRIDVIASDDLRVERVHISPCEPAQPQEEKEEQ